MGEFVYSRPVPADIEALAQGIRPQDRDELEATHGEGVDILGILTRGVALTPHPLVATDAYGRTLCVLGIAVGTLLSDVGIPWLIGTIHLEKHHRALAHDGRVYIEDALTLYPRLVNHVDARNKWSIAYLRRLGFTLDPVEAFGVQGLPFHRFHKRA